MSDFSNAMGLGFADGGGLTKLFQGFAQGDLLRQKAELEAGLKTAQAYHHNMSGNLSGTKANAERFTLDNRQNIDSLIASNPEFAQNLQTAMKVWAMTGKGDPHNISQASGDFQKQQSVADIQSGTADPLKTGQAYFAVSGKAPYSNAKADGYSLNGMTGAQIEGNPIVAKLYQGLEQAKTSHQRASAGAQGALAGKYSEQTKEIKQGKLVDGVDKDGNPITYQYGTSGVPKILQDIKPLVKSGGADAARMKHAARISTEVFKDPMIAPDDKQAEIEKRLNMLDVAAGNKPAPKAAEASAAPDKNALLSQARDAIAKGAPRDKVLQRLKENGVDSSGL